MYLRNRDPPIDRLDVRDEALLLPIKFDLDQRNEGQVIAITAGMAIAPYSHRKDETVCLKQK
jgi:hypothetical protein